LAEIFDSVDFTMVTKKALFSSTLSKELKTKSLVS
jgi:hypothetical protein